MPHAGRHDEHAYGQGSASGDGGHRQDGPHRLATQPAAVEQTDGSHHDAPVTALVPALVPVTAAPVMAAPVMVAPATDGPGSPRTSARVAARSMTPGSAFTNRPSRNERRRSPWAAALGSWVT